MYWILSMVGMLLSFGFLWLRKKKFSVPKADVFYLFLLALVGALAGAKILYWITIIPIVVQDFQILIQHPDIFMEMIVNGYVFYGGLIGGFLICYWYCRKFRISFGEVTELFTPILPFFHIFGRIGCFCAGCCYGIPVSWGIPFTQAVGGPNGIPLLPLQLIESSCNAIILAAVLVFDHFFRGKRLTLPFYAVLYAVCRFILEFFRGDLDRGVILLSTSQWVSIGIVLAVGIWFFIMIMRKKQKRAVK